MSARHYCGNLTCCANRIDPEASVDGQMIDGRLPSWDGNSEATPSRAGQEFNQGTTHQYRLK
jgi:hypothetical protein